MLFKNSMIKIYSMIIALFFNNEICIWHGVKQSRIENTIMSFI